MNLHKRVVSFLLSLCMLGTSLPVFPAYAVESDLPPIQILSEEPDTPTDVFELTDIAVNQTADVATVSLTASADSTLILALYDEDSMFDSISTPITGAAEAQEIEVEIDPGRRGCFTVKAFLLEPETYACLCKKNTTIYTEWQDVKDVALLEAEDIACDEEHNLYYVSNTLLVLFEPDVTLFEIDALCSAIGGEVIGLDDVVKMYQFRVEASSLNELLELAEEAMAYDYVTYATFDSVTPGASCAVTAVVPNDPWNNDVNATDWRNADVDGSNWWIEAIDAQYAWAYNDQMAYITLGVVDRSFDQGHEDLENKVEFPDLLMEIRNDDTPWYNDFDNESWGASTQHNAHGTHVAGIIGADADNNKGLTGLVWDSTISIAPAPDMSDSQIYSGISHLVEGGAKVVNMSLGRSHLVTKNVDHWDEPSLQYMGNFAAIWMARLLDEVGDFILVQSAGNGDTNGVPVDAIENGDFCCITEACYTASDTTTIQDVLDHVIIVGAAEQQGSTYRCASFSNYGERVDICAPGQDIYSTLPGETGSGFEFTGGYGKKSGTSMAAPIVTGVCGMVWAANPDLDGATVKKIVCQSTDETVAPHPDSGSDMSYSMVNAQLAVETALKYKEGIIPVTVTVKNLSGTPVAGATIKINDNPTFTGKEITTRSDGTATFFLEEGSYYLSAASGEYYAAQRLDLTEKTEIEFSLQKTYFIWSLDESGTHLTVNGYGPMPNYSKNTWWPKTITSAEIHGVDSISADAFTGHSNLTEVTLDDTIANIGRYAFSNCKNLTEIDLPDELFSLGFSAFYQCDSLSSVTIPGKTVLMDESIFYACDNLATVVLEHGIRNIPGRMFESCPALSSVTMPNSITEICAEAFYNSGLVSISLPNSITSIGNKAFSSTGLTSINLPTALTTLGFAVFENCTSLTSISMPDSVTTIDDKLFIGCTALSSVILSENLTEISCQMFEDCSSLSSIRIPNSVTLIDNLAFTNSGLTSITVPGSVTTIGDEVWRSCKSLLSVTLQNGVSSIGQHAFSSCTKLTTASLPGSLTAIGDSLFSGCSALTSATLGTGITTISNSMFSGCKKLYSFTIPSTVTTIGESAFYNCKILPFISLPSGLTSIGSNAFKDCDAITSISLPSSVTMLRTGTFSGCDTLQSISLPFGLTSIGASVFYGCKALQSISLPSSVNSIGSDAFYNCDALTHVTIPDGITYITSSLFYSCDKLTSVTIPSTVNKIGTNVFTNCKALTDIYFGGTSTQWEEISGNVKLSNKVTIHFSA